MTKVWRWFKCNVFLYHRIDNQFSGDCLDCGCFVWRNS